VQIIEEVERVIELIHSILPTKILLFTFRTLKEGGQRELCASYYKYLYQYIVKHPSIDMIDVELSCEEVDIQDIVTIAHAYNKVVIISYHHFQQTPDKEQMIEYLCLMQALQGDIVKIAVMPNHLLDVLQVLEVTTIAKEKYIDCPIIAISMGEQGTISRM